ncbi:hypothetical protein AB0C18_07485 [Nonomuraea muscovyensis]|jgi:hypothetical protein|uniref:hypothetical protein n=1 Tax=Nonomuraea muscovyensis TaxID=1124761 RepID=UPI0033F3A6BB|nr:hypothetical protein [Nonomuraea muscovyensis]
MHDPTEPDRQEILTGPGEESRAPRKRRQAGNRTVLIAASALVGLLAAGGIGFSLAGGDPAQPDRPTQSQSPGTAEGPGEDLGDDGDATMGDVTTEEPGDGTRAEGGGEDDTASVGDETGGVADDGGTDDTSTGAAGSDSKGTSESKNTNVNKGRQPTTAPAEDPAGTTADGAADGPSGEVAGQCAKSGC